jgi:hypothetical protein
VNGFLTYDRTTVQKVTQDEAANYTRGERLAAGGRRFGFGALFQGVQARLSPVVAGSLSVKQNRENQHG